MLLNSVLSRPIRLTFEELEQRYATARGKADLDAWMRDEQGWTLAADAEGIRDNLERAAKFSCYALVNRLVFYEALISAMGRSFINSAYPSTLMRATRCACTSKDSSSKLRRSPATMRRSLAKTIPVSAIVSLFTLIMPCTLGAP